MMGEVVDIKTGKLLKRCPICGKKVDGIYLSTRKEINKFQAKVKKDDRLGDCFNELFEQVNENSDTFEYLLWPICPDCYYKVMHDQEGE